VGATNAAPGTGTYTTNALNQYTALGAEVLLYDINGNLTTQGLSASYSYDSKNRLIGATKGTETMSATYDYQNRQVSRTMNNGVSYFIYDGWNLIGEYTANGSMWQKHIHGAATDEILAKTDGAGTFYYHHDGLGSTVALTNSSGNVIESYLYDVYGKPTVLNASNTIITASAFGNRFLFTGREWIRRIGIYDYRNRIYSPDLGRFLQTDPIRFDAGDVNIYRYVFNTPVNWVDPSGKMGVVTSGVLIAVISYIIVKVVLEPIFDPTPPAPEPPPPPPGPEIDYDRDGDGIPDSQDPDPDKDYRFSSC